MKSKIVDCVQGMPSDRHWRRLVLDFDEMVEAVSRNDVSRLIRCVLEPEYGTLYCFDVMLLQLTRSVMAAVSAALPKGVPNRFPLAVIFRHDVVERVEKLANHLSALTNA